MTLDEKAKRTAQWVELRKNGATVKRIAEMHAVNERTVRRALAASGQMDRPATYYRLKPKRQKVVEGLAKGLTTREALLDAGYAESTARSGGTGIVGPMERKAVGEIFLAALPVEKVAAKLAEGAEAEEVRLVAHQGNVRGMYAFADFGTRRTYLELWGKFTGLLKDPAGAQFTGPVQIVLDL